MFQSISLLKKGEGGRKNSVGKWKKSWTHFYMSGGAMAVKYAWARPLVTREIQTERMVGNLPPIRRAVRRQHHSTVERPLTHVSSICQVYRKHNTHLGKEWADFKTKEKFKYIQ